MKKYSNETVAKIMKIITDTRASNGSFPDAAKAVNNAGIRTTKGKPFTASLLYVFSKSRAKSAPRVTKTNRTVQKPGFFSETFVKSILSEPNLTDSKRVSLLNTYLSQ